MVKKPDTPLVAATRNQAMNTNHQGSPLGEELFLPSPEKLGVRDHLESQPEGKKIMIINQSAVEQKPKSQFSGSVGIENNL